MASRVAYLSWTLWLSPFGVSSELVLPKVKLKNWHFRYPFIFIIVACHCSLSRLFGILHCTLLLLQHCSCVLSITMPPTSSFVDSPASVAKLLNSLNKLPVSQNLCLYWYQNGRPQWQRCDLDSSTAGASSESRLPHWRRRPAWENVQREGDERRDTWKHTRICYLPKSDIRRPSNLQACSTLIFASIYKAFKILRWWNGSHIRAPYLNLQRYSGAFTRVSNRMLRSPHWKNRNGKPPIRPREGYIARSEGARRKSFSTGR